MKVVGYEKTDQGPVIVDVCDVDINQESETVIERFDAFFKDVPLHGGKEWKTLSVNEIVPIFREAAVEIRKMYQAWHDAAIQQHSTKNPLIRWWLEIRGWTAPCVPSEKELIEDIATRCMRLSSWMGENSTRPFYAGSDMNYLICKPKEVAEKLLKA
ncbi:MAG: hypothetical protein ACD_56C00146G0015 [uncultured bacterium]|nr:MAG: hypothetical protein ACD_56C00146G0015 [uncultured bacterium]